MRGIAGRIERREFRIDQRHGFERLLGEARARAAPPVPAVVADRHEDAVFDRDAFVERERHEAGIAEARVAEFAARRGSALRAGARCRRSWCPRTTPSPRRRAHSNRCAQVRRRDTAVAPAYDSFAQRRVRMREPERRIGLRARVLQPFERRHPALEERAGRRAATPSRGAWRMP